MGKMKRVVLLTMIVLILSACSKNDSSPSGTTGDGTQNNYEETQPVWRLNEFTAGQDGFYYRLGDFNGSPSVRRTAGNMKSQYVTAWLSCKNDNSFLLFP